MAQSETAEEKAEGKADSPMEDQYERLMALVERLCSAMSMPHPAPVINVNVDMGSLMRALEKRRTPDTGTVVVDRRGPTPVPG